MLHHGASFYFPFPYTPEAKPKPRSQHPLVHEKAAGMPSARQGSSKIWLQGVGYLRLGCWRFGRLDAKQRVCLCLCVCVWGRLGCLGVSTFKVRCMVPKVLGV